MILDRQRLDHHLPIRSDVAGAGDRPERPLDLLRDLRLARGVGLLPFRHQLAHLRTGFLRDAVLLGAQVLLLGQRLAATLVQVEDAADVDAHGLLPGAFSERATSTLKPRDQHIRYLNEARAGEPLIMRAGVMETTETSALLYQQLDHADGRPCATFRTWVDHIELDTGIAFPWSKPMLDELAGYPAEPIETGAPRSIDFNATPAAAATMADANKIEALTIGRGVVPPAHCDVYGDMLPEMFVARVSDSVGVFLNDWRHTLERNLGGEAARDRIGGAVIESRWVYRRWPRAGDRFVIRTAIASLSENTQAYHHWLLDPRSGKAWGTNHTVAIAFDLEKRRLHKITQEDQEAMRALAPMGLFV